MCLDRKHIDYSMYQCVITLLYTQIQNTLLLILILILRLVKYSEIVDTISLVTMTHTIYFIAQVYFKLYCMVVEHVNTTVLIRKK